MPAALAAIVERLMQKVPENRYASVAEAVEELKPLAAAHRPKTLSDLRPLSVQNAREGMRSPGSAPGFGPRSSGSAPGFAPNPSGSGPGFTASTTAPSTPTPKPQALGSLPSRDSFKGSSPSGPRPKTMLAFAQPQADGEGANPDEQREERVIPGNDSSPVVLTLEERLGPFGVVVTTIATCAAVYFLAAWFGLFR